MMMSSSLSVALRTGWLAAGLVVLTAAYGSPGCLPPPLPSPDAGDPCAVKGVTLLGQSQIQVSSPDGTQYLANQLDDAGVYQVYLAPTGTQALRCLTCAQVPGGPPVGAHKLMAEWHPSGNWILVGTQMAGASWPPLVCNDTCQLGLLRSGVNLDMYAMNADGTQWFPLVQFDPTQSSQGSGYTGPAFTPDGAHAYWAKIVSGDIFQYTFGKWLLMRSDFQVDASGVPSLQNTVDVTPGGANWVEPGNFTPDGTTLLLSADIGLPSNAANGQDQWAFNVQSGALTQLTHTPDAWDEHGLYSPDGRKIVWMSSLPFPGNDNVWDLKTEFLLMDADGSNVYQLTHFNYPGYPEYNTQGTVAAVAVWTPDGSHLFATQLLADQTSALWRIDFNAGCGNAPP
jgi:hypothetical protein